MEPARFFPNSGVIADSAGARCVIADVAVHAVWDLMGEERSWRRRSERADRIYSLILIVAGALAAAILGFPVGLLVSVVYELRRPERAVTVTGYDTAGAACS